MALTPAQRHRASVLASQAQAASPYGETQGSAYELMLAKLATDKRTLKNLQSVQLKRQAKATMLADYLPWIDGVLEGGKGGRDTVLTTVMVWAIDASAYGLALRIAAYVLQHQLPLPDQYQRSTAAVLLDEFSDAYLRGHWQAIHPDTTPDDTPAVEHLSAVIDLTAAHDAPDQARAKLYKACAYALLGKVQTAEDAKLDEMPDDALACALDLLACALRFDSQSGVKKDIERIERKQRAREQARAKPPAPPAPADTPADPAQKTAPKPAKAASKKPAAR